jgi:hypothetical protein
MFREERARNPATPWKIRTAQEAKNNKPPRIKRIARIVSHSNAIYIPRPTRRHAEPHLKERARRERAIACK